MKILTRGFVTPIFLIIILLALGGWVYYYAQTSKTLQESVSATASSTALTQPITQTPPISSISEQVRCLFHGATAFLTAQGEQKCYGEVPSQTVGDNPTRYSCAGVKACDVAVSGRRDTSVTWSSSCGVSADTTKIDGKGEYVNFFCKKPFTGPVATTATIMTSSLFASAFIPTTISGIASPVGGALDLVVGDRARVDGVVVQSDGTWSALIKSGFPIGSYPVIVYSHTSFGPDGTAIATDTLTIVAASGVFH